MSIVIKTPADVAGMPRWHEQAEGHGQSTRTRTRMSDAVVHPPVHALRGEDCVFFGLICIIGRHLLFVFGASMGVKNIVVSIRYFRYEPLPSPVFSRYYYKRFLPKSAPPLPFNIHVPSSRNVLLFCTPSAFLLFSLTILAHLCLPVFRIMYFVM